MVGEVNRARPPGGWGLLRHDHVHEVVNVKALLNSAVGTSQHRDNTKWALLTDRTVSPSKGYTEALVSSTSDCGLIRNQGVGAVMR